MRATLPFSELIRLVHMIITTRFELILYLFELIISCLSKILLKKPSSVAGKIVLANIGGL